MDPSFTISEDRSEQLPSVEEARMMSMSPSSASSSRRQSNASSLGKSSDIETAYSGSVEEAASEHDQLPSVDDVRMNSPRSSQRGGRCRVFVAAALLAVVVIVVTVAVAITQTGTETKNEFPMATGGSYENNDFSTSTTPTEDTPTTTTTTTTAPQPEEETPSEPVVTTPPAAPEDRYTQIVQLVQDRGVSNGKELTTDGSPQQMAADWIANQDAAAVSLDEPEKLMERYIVTVLYYAMGGESWTNRLNFLTKDDVCKWYIAGYAGDNKSLRQFGINCNDQGTINKLHFPSNFLVGPFPLELTHLKDLERLDVFNNPRITGGFPAFLNGMTKINFVGIHYCGIQGQLPTWLGSLTSLKSLVLSNNQFTGSLPASMAQLTNLEDLYLDDNQFSGDIIMLSGLSKLENLILEDNSFEGVLDGDMVSSWSQLQVFDASHNKLQSTIPASLFTLPYLRVLDLHTNKFSGTLPKLPSSRPTLELLTLNANDLSGAIPTELSYFNNLKTLDLSENAFSSTIPSNLGSMAKLEYLFMALNPLDAGGIPTFLSGLVSLKQLSLKGTKRTGSIPDWMGNLENMVFLDLDMNSLQGTIPSSLGNLNKMEYLLLNRNELEGTVPSTLSSMSSLAFFMIDQNKLTGTAAPVCTTTDNVEMFVADCQGTTPEIACPCCNVCCSAGNDQCNDNVWLGDSNPIWELGFERPMVELDASATRSYKVQFAGDILP